MKSNRNPARRQAPPAPVASHAPAAPHASAAPYPPAAPHVSAAPHVASVPHVAAAPPAPGPAPGVAVPRLEPTLPEGLHLGAFEIKGVISQSRAAVVYRVSDHSLGIPAAIKEYMPLGVARRGNGHQVVPVEAWHEDTIDLGRRAFFAESRALARCDDPSLLRVTQLWEINGTAYRVMPLYSGKRLVDLRRDMKAPIDETALRAMLERLLDALGAYHASAGVHGNLTPMNILMPALDRPVLLGPGKASVLLATELGEPVRSDFEAAFAAPEQHEGADAAVIGPSADLFGLAQTLRYGITGAAPIGQESLRASIHRLLGAGAVSNYSDALLDALSSATATAPAERPQSLDEFRQRLRRLEAQGVARGAPVQPPVAAASAPAATAVPNSELPTVAQVAALPDSGEFDETIDVSSVLGDLLQEPAGPRPPDDEAPGPRAPDPRTEPRFNFAFDIPVPPGREPPGHAPNSPRVHVEHPRGPTHEHPYEHAREHAHEHAHEHAGEHPRPQAPRADDGPDPAFGAAADRTSAYHASMYDDSHTAQMAAPYRPKDSRPNAPVMRMIGFIGAMVTLAIVVILVVSGVWDPRGRPELSLPSTATSDGAATPSGAQTEAPAPIGEAPASAAAAPPAVTAETPAPSAVRPPVTVQPPVAAAPPPVAAPPLVTAPAPVAAPVTAPVAAPLASAPAAVAPPPTARTNKAPPRRGSTTEVAPDPREACAGRTQFALYRCMQAQCARSRWAAHPECVQLRKSDRVDPP